MFRGIPTTKRGSFPAQNRLISFYKEEVVCSLRGTDRIFKYNSG